MQPPMWDGLDDYDDVVLLYRGLGYDPGGLAMSLTSAQVCLLEDAFAEPQQCVFADLDVVLEAYLRCIEAGKFVVDAVAPGFGDGDGLVAQGWRVEPWTEGELSAALQRWDGLVEAIVKRMPGDAAKAEMATEESSVLVPAELLNAYPAIPPFARAFLSRAKKPPFTSIAPHLQVPDVPFIQRVGSQLSKRCPDLSLSDQQHDLIDGPWFLLFPWKTPGIEFAAQKDRNTWDRNERQSRLLDNSAGLYLVPDDVSAHSVRLLLPFALGANGHIRRSDGSTFNTPRHDVLYAHGVCHPFFPGHGAPLAAVLANWTEQLENGCWSVDADGVAGGDEMWRKADTEADAEDFVIEHVCF